MALQLRAGPAQEPVSLEEAKTFMRLDGTQDDVLVSTLITAARIHIETTIGKVLITENWSFFLDKWPKSKTIYFPLDPIQEIEEIRFHNSEDSYTVIDVEDYSIDLVSSNPRLLFNGAKPTAPSKKLNQLEIRFVAGYGDTPADVPSDLKQALLMLAAHWFEQRDPIAFGGSFAEIPRTIEALLSNYKKYKVQ